MEAAMEKHVTFIAVVNIALGLIGVMVALLLFALIAGGGLIGSMTSHEVPPMFITSIVGSVIAFMITLFSVPGIIGGIGLLYRKPWARILMLIFAFMNLLNIPIGTLIGIYTIWVLLQNETVRLFSV